MSEAIPAQATEAQSPKGESTFKKPVLFGKVGKLPKKLTHDQLMKLESRIFTDPIEGPWTVASIADQKADECLSAPVDIDTTPTPSSTEKPAENSTYLPYKEPLWSGMPETTGKKYEFEVLKNGVIIGTLDLMSKPYWLFGRLSNCDICMQHPTISRYHAVLQYRSEGTESEEPGFYIYDLGSTHGTFLNKNKLRSRVYTKVQVGHMLKLGCSTRAYILCGPEEDAEEESPLSITELKRLRLEELVRREVAAGEAKLEKKRQEEERKKKEEERGVDWGLGDDAVEEEETDLSENPFAQTNNEELYLDNPKKALRGFYEREGLDLEYDCSEQGMGQFLCKVELPLDDEMGRPIFAEVIHKGKKKEAVAMCALEACRMLDRYGVLRQATHESRKRKPKNWEENDFYDSDDDTFLDRTGTIEKKREMRMSAKAPARADTYESLLDKEMKIGEEIAKCQKALSEAQAKLCAQSCDSSEEDPLDSFMKDLKQSKPDKRTVNKLKLEMAKLKKDHANIIRLVNIAKPTNLPDLVVPDYEDMPGTSGKETKRKSQLPVFGKRKKIKVEVPAETGSSSRMDVDDSEEEEETVEQKVEEEVVEYEQEIESTNDRVESPLPISEPNPMTLTEFEEILERQKLPLFSGKHRDSVKKILSKLKKLASDGDRMHVDWKVLEAKKRKIMKFISDMNEGCSTCPDEKLEFKVSSELNRIINELNVMTGQKFKVINKVKEMGYKLKTISDEIESELKSIPESEATSSSGCCSSSSTSSSSAKKEKQKARQQLKADRDKQKGYDEDSRKEDYNMWVPPENQTGDGRTSLNDKLGY